MPLAIQYGMTGSEGFEMDSMKNVDGVHMHLENKKVSRNFFWMLWLMYAVVYMTKNCYSAAMASIVHEGVLTKSQTGFISAAFYFVYAPLQIVGGVFADKYNPERMIKIGLIGGGLANLIIFCNQNYYVMLFAWIFNSIIQFALWPSVFKIISSQLEAEYKVKGIYYITFSSTFGLLLAYVVAAVVSKWQYNFALSAGMLFLFALLFHFVSNRVEKYMVPDTNPRKKPEKVEVQSEVSSWKLFLFSGFLLMVIVTALRTIVSNGIQTLSSTMLMESYEHISPSLGNMLNTLIIISGLLGVMIVNQFIYPKLIRSEVGATLLLVGLSIVPVIILTNLGKVSTIVTVVALCFAAAILNGSGLLMSRCSAMFVKYGKNGLASGINNSSAAIAIMIQSYGVLSLADHQGWKSVTWLWLILLILSCLCAAVAVPLWRRFKAAKAYTDICPKKISETNEKTEV